MPWFVAPRVTAAVAGQEPGASLEVRVQGADRVDQLEGGADGPLGVVLVGGRRAPHRHDRVADELLDRPAVELDDLGGGLEVAAQQLADGLGIAVLGEAREADEVGEQDGDQAPLGRRRSGRGSVPAVGRRGGAQRLAAGGAEARVVPVRLAAVRAGGRERAAAVVAELAAAAVLDAAARADHAGPPLVAPRSVADRRNLARLARWCTYRPLSGRSCTLRYESAKQIGPAWPFGTRSGTDRPISG